MTVTDNIFKENADYPYGFVLNEINLGHVCDAAKRLFNADTRTVDEVYRAQYDGRLETETRSLDKLLNYNVGAKRVTKLEIIMSDGQRTVQITFSDPTVTGIPHRKSVTLQIAGRNEHEVRSVRMLFETVIERMRRRVLYPVKPSIGLYAFIALMSIISVIPLRLTNELSTSSVVAILLVPLTTLALVHLFIRFYYPAYNFCWGEFQSAYEQVEAKRRILVEIVILGLIISTIGSIIGNQISKIFGH